MSTLIQGEFTLGRVGRLCLSLLCCLAFAVLQPGVSCYGERLPVVASIFPLADMVEKVGGEHVDVTTIIPAGASPHTFSPKPSQVKKISAARVFFMVGAGLETWAAKFAEHSKQSMVKVVLSEGVSLIRGTQEHHHHDHHQDHDAPRTDDGDGAANPHIWLDPTIAGSMVGRIAETLSNADPGNMRYYSERAKGYIKDIGNLDHMIIEAVGAFTVKKFVAFHPAWEYFARRYGLECVGVIETAPGRNPTPKKIMAIVAEIKKHDIRAIFAEPQLNPKVAEVIAKEADAKVLVLDPIGGPGVSGRGTYIDLMKYNLAVLEEAMR